VLDSGALVALERNDRAMWCRLKDAALTAQPPLSHGGVIGQVWRGRGSRHALLARALQGIEVAPLDAERGRAAGELVGRARQKDVIDAAVILLANDGDTVVTSDPDDLVPLAEASGIHLELVAV